MYTSNTKKQLNRTTDGELLSKNVFTTNWYMYKVCLPLVLKDHGSLVQSQLQNCRRKNAGNVRVREKEAKKGHNKCMQ